MRKFSAITALGIGLAALIAAAWQEPRIRTLFSSSSVRKDPLAFLRDVKVPDPPPVAEKPVSGVPPPTQAPAGPPPPAGAPTAEPPASAYKQVPNPEVARVLMQVLRARKLAGGISLSVSDTEIAVHGSVPSQEHLDKIRAILEMGREARKLDLSRVQIGTPETP
jgi:hypothetical protein